MIRPMLGWFLLPLVSLAGPGPGSAARVGDPLEAQVDTIMADWARPGSPGCAVGVMQNGSLAFAKGYQATPSVVVTVLAALP